MILTTAAAAALTAALIFVALKYIAGQPALLRDRNGKAPNLCEGGWREAKLRGCEHGYAVTGIPVEPVSTYSCVAYPVAAWVTLESVGPGAAEVFFLTMLFLGLGSALYHGVKTQWAASLDDAGMYAAFGGLTLYAMVAGHPLDLWMMAFAALVGLVVLGYLVEGNLLVGMGIFLTVIWAGIFTTGNATLGLYGVGLFALAMAAWQIDLRSGLLGRFGHGIWHVLTAAAMSLTFASIG